MTDALTASFLFSARSRSLYNASRKLGITPQAVSKNIKKLEQEVGFELFEDKMGTPALTPQGQRFMKYLIAEDRQFNWTWDNAQRIASPTSGALRVGVYSELFLSDSFYKVLRGRVSCRCYEPESMKYELLQGELDVVVLHGHSAGDERIASRRFVNFPMVLAASRTLARKKGASSAADFTDMPIYVVEGAVPELGERTGNRLFCSRFEKLALDPDNIRVVPTIEDVEAALMLERGVSLCDISSRLSVCPVFDIFPTGDMNETRLCCRRGEENTDTIASLIADLIINSQEILREITAAGHRTEYAPY